MAVILILEDDFSLAYYWCSLLEKEAHQVFCCETAEQALATVSQQHPDLLILDMLIKQEDHFVPQGGLTVINQLKNRPGPSVPVIGVSGYRPSRYNMITALEVAKSIGVSVALYKPIQPEQLQTAVRKLLND